MLVLVVLREFSDLVPRWLPGAAAWLALPLLWPRISGALRRQAGVLAGIGALAFALGEPGRPASRQVPCSGTTTRFWRCWRR